MEWNDIAFTDESRFCVQHHNGRIPVWRHRGQRLLNCCVLHSHIDPGPCIMVYGSFGYHYRTLLVRIADILNSQGYIFEVSWASHTFSVCHQPSSNRIMRYHTWHAILELFFTHQIVFLPRIACFPVLSPMKNVCSMLAHRLALHTPTAATLNQLWHYVEAACTAVPQGYIQSLFDSMPRNVAAVIANNGGYTNQNQAVFARRRS
ncbi:transposable element Tcb1 transposase [Trichonephila clavipes]|nr:transposable element Tcb1 transposase [Trichonephila clavipes]